MTTQAPEREQVDPGYNEDYFEQFEFDVACDIGGLRINDSAYPPCKGDPARWVAWRPNCCGKGPQYRVVCDFCKKVYQRWQAHQAHISCPYCNTDTGGFVSFTPLKGKL